MGLSRRLFGLHFDRTGVVSLTPPKEGSDNAEMLAANYALIRALREAVLRFDEAIKESVKETQNNDKAKIAVGDTNL
jgi:hypothetical protein